MVLESSMYHHTPVSFYCSKFERFTKAKAHLCSSLSPEVQSPKLPVCDRPVYDTLRLVCTVFGLVCVYACSPKHDPPLAGEALHAVRLAVVVDHGPAGVQPNPDGTKLLVAYGVVVASKPSQQQCHLAYAWQ